MPYATYAFFSPCHTLFAFAMPCLLFCCTLLMLLYFDVAAMPPLFSPLLPPCRCHDAAAFRLEVAAIITLLRVESEECECA